MNDLLPWIIAAVVVLVVFLVGRAKERAESDPGISLFGGEPPEFQRPPEHPVDPPPPDEPQ